MREENQKVIPVKVALRCRPLISREVEDGCQPCLRMVSGEPQVILGKDRAFTYDFAFSPTDPQKEVYENSAKALLGSIFKGFNATILAYGQTGSGKTFTMGGCYESSLSGDDEHMGIIPRVLQDVFQGINEREQQYEFNVRVSYMEIYNEEVNDLLCSSSQRDSLSIREETTGGIRIAGLKEIPVSNFKETMGHLSSGSEGRTTGATAMNTTSSRSHAIFTLHIEQKKKDELDDCCKVKFHLVDLAGSERCNRTKAEGERFKEGVNINKGLLALGNVISALGEEAQKRNHIPYRDSKLTRILQDSLGGNSHTLMIACVSPADSNIEESLNTLRYADRARKIKNKPVINRDPQAAEIMRLKMLVHQLQGQLLGGGISSSSSIKPEMSTSTSTLSSDTTIDQSSEEIKKLNRCLSEVKDENVRLTKELQRSLEQRTRMMEDVLHLESKVESLKERMTRLQSETGINLDLLSSSVDVGRNPEAKLEMEKLYKLIESVKHDKEIPEEEEPKEEEEDHENTDDEEEDDTGPERESSPTRISSVSTPDHTLRKKHALRQADFHRQLEEINNVLKRKQGLVEKMCVREQDMESIKLQYDSEMIELRTMVEDKQKEINDLKGAQVHSSSTVSKVAEQRRKRVQDLETQISQLKQKMVEQSRDIKNKDKSDKQVSQLHTEIVAMKQQRVRLMKQIKEENSNFQKWKREKDKEVTKLQAQDRKREFQLKKLKNEFDRHQTVQKRKTAEAVAANKRLRDILAKRKEVEKDKTGKLEKADASNIGNKVRKWLGQELDIRVSMKENKYYLEELHAQRKSLCQQLQSLSQQLEDGPVTDKFSWLGENGDSVEIMLDEKDIKEKMMQCQVDIQMLNLQIEDTQQKIFDAEQDTTGKISWQNVHTMKEAQLALKFLLEQAVNAKVEHIKTNGDLQSLKDSEKDDGAKIKELKSSHSQLKNKHDRQMDKLRQDYEEKLIACTSGVGNGKGVNKTVTKKVHKLEDDNDSLRAKLSMKQKECEQMQQKMTRVMYQNKTFNLMPDIDSCTSPFLNPTPKLKQDTEEASLNSTFVVNEENEDKVVPLPTTKGNIKRASSNTENETPENKSLENSEDGISDLTVKIHPVKKLRRRTGTAYMKSTEDAGSDDSPNTSSFLKRRSADEPEDLESSEDGQKKRKRRLLSSNTSGFFSHLNGQ